VVVSSQNVREGHCAFCGVQEQAGHVNDGTTRLSCASSKAEGNAAGHDGAAGPLVGPDQSATGPVQPSGVVAQVNAEQFGSAQSTRLSSSSSTPFWQFSTRVWHVPFTQFCPTLHARPGQPPQWASSVCVFTQMLLQLTVGDVQFVLHVPLEQSWPPWHTVVQLPQ
jgi:hypothetical protein